MNSSFEIGAGNQPVADALRESEQRFRLVFDNASDMMAVLRVEPGPDFRLLFVNRHYLETVRAAGYAVSAADLAGRALDEITRDLFRFDAKVVQTIRERFRRVAESRQPLRYEEVEETPRGRWYGDTTLTPIADASGHCAFVLYTSRDITARKQAEEALRKSEERFRAIIEDQTEMIVRWKPDTTRTFVNAAYCRTFGRSYDELIGTSFFPLIAEADREAIRQKILSITPEHPVAVETHRSLGPGGEILWQEWMDRGLFDEEGRLVELQSVGRDVTARKRAELFAEAHRQALEKIAAGAPLSETLELIVRFVEAQNPASICSILLLDEEQRVRHAAAPNLPEAYCRAIDGFKIGPNAGSCGTAAALGRNVSVADIATDPLWVDYRELALDHGLRACWSMPVFSKRRKVLGTFAIYYREPRNPEPRELGVVENITHLAAVAIERAQEEARLLRLNRLYAVSSSINEAIVRLREPQKLYEAACRIAVEEGLLRLAWVGLIDETTRILTPVCSWGNDDGYTANLRISIDDTPHGRGTGGRAVRTGAYAFSNDLEHDPAMAPWREASLARGFRSIASFPLKVGDRVIGVIAVLAGQPDFFTADELQLLNALAENLSFAIELSQKEQERRQAAEALSENQRVLSTLLGNLSGMAYRCRNDEHWTMEFVSEGCRELTGYAPEDLLYNRVASYEIVTHPEDRVPVRAQIEAALQAGRRFDLVYRIVTAGGVEKWVWERGVGIFSPAGGLLHLEGFITDITERRQAQDKIHSQAALLDKAQDAIIVRALDNTVLYWNKSAERLYGVPCAEVMGHKVTELIYRDPAAFNEARRLVLERGDWSGTLAQVTRDGRELTVESRWTLVRDDHGQPKSVLVINTDITEKKKLESQFLRAQRIENIGTLAGGIAHDLNNVLTPILIATELLQLKIQEPDDLAVLESIHTSANRGAAMIRQILSFARGAEGKRIRVDPRQVVKAVQQICKDTFPKSIEITTVLPDDIQTVSGDPTQLHQVLLNLCVNARDAMPQGGALAIRLENVLVDDRHAARHAELKRGLYVILTVSDTGTGIPQAIMDRIFDPFFTTKEVGKGTGLGLATVQSIIKSHGGMVHVESKLGQGTTFSVYLPAGATRDREERQSPRSTLPRGNGELILVVDDEEPIRAVALQMLQKFGYRVLTAGNGEEALRIYAQQPREIALVITDMMMPVMDGPATIHAIFEINPRAHILAVSGYSSSDGVARAVAAGVKYFLAKPYTAEALLTLLREILRGGPAGGAASAGAIGAPFP